MQDYQEMWALQNVAKERSKTSRSKSDTSNLNFSHHQM